MTHTVAKSKNQSYISPLAFDAIRIVDMYIKKYSIKALRIEESDEKLIIMEKPPNLDHIKFPQDEFADITEFLKVKQEQTEEESQCVKIKVEPDLIIEDIGENTQNESCHTPVMQQLQIESNEANAPIETNQSEITELFNLNQHILSIVEAIHSKVDSISIPNRVETESHLSTYPYHSVEEEDPDDDFDEFPEDFHAVTLGEVERLEKLLKKSKHKQKLEQLLKEKLKEHENDYESFLKSGLNLLMPKPTQCIVAFERSLTPLRSVRCLLNVAHHFFATPISDLEKYVNHLLSHEAEMFTKKMRTKEWKR
jgi:hypothetical protein